MSAISDLLHHIPAVKLGGHYSITTWVESKANLDQSVSITGWAQCRTLQECHPTSRCSSMKKMKPLYYEPKFLNWPVDWLSWSRITSGDLSANFSCTLLCSAISCFEYFSGSWEIDETRYLLSDGLFRYITGCYLFLNYFLQFTWGNILVDILGEPRYLGPDVLL